MASLSTGPARPWASAALKRAFELGRDVYSSLTPEGQRALHLRGRKHQSLRKIARLRDIPNSTLSRAVGVYLLFLSHPELHGYSHVRLCHVAMTLGLDAESRAAFLQKIEKGRWSRAQLARAMKKRISPPPAALTSLSNQHSDITTGENQ